MLPWLPSCCCHALRQRKLGAHTASRTYLGEAAVTSTTCDQGQETALFIGFPISWHIVGIILWESHSLDILNQMYNPALRALLSSVVYRPTFSHPKFSARACLKPSLTDGPFQGATSCKSCWSPAEMNGSRYESSFGPLGSAPWFKTKGDKAHRFRTWMFSIIMDPSPSIV